MLDEIKQHLCKLFRKWSKWLDVSVEEPLPTSQVLASQVSASQAGRIKSLELAADPDVQAVAVDVGKRLQAGSGLIPPMGQGELLKLRIKT